MGDRPYSRGGRLHTGASGRPMQMRSGLTTGTGIPPGTSSRQVGQLPGGGLAVNVPVNVSDRPITQQGLGGMRTAAGGLRTRQIQDGNYYLGLLRSKVQDISSENIRLQKDIDFMNEENSTYLSYEKRAEALANDIKELQGQLGDYNMLVDKLNTDTDMDDVQSDFEDLKHQNDMEEKTMDSIFSERQDKESQIKRLEQEIRDVQSFAESIVGNMDPATKRQYDSHFKQNSELIQSLETRQQHLESVNNKIQLIEQDVSNNVMKFEATQLYSKLHELEEKKRQLQGEMKSKDSPRDERERLLQQVKDDNQAIANMERQMTDIKGKISILDEEIESINADIDDSHSEKHQKLIELKNREHIIDEFLLTYDANKEEEQRKLKALEQQVVVKLEMISRGLAQSMNLPTTSDLETVKGDLSFKSGELTKARNTEMGLQDERSRRQQELVKIQQLEPKLKLELESIKEKMEKMKSDLLVYQDIDRLKGDGESKRMKLQEDKVSLKKRRDVLKIKTSLLSNKYESGKNKLDENETYSQLCNLERRWQNYELNNQVIKDVVATKTMESDFKPIQRNIDKIMNSYNKMLQGSLTLHR